MTIHVSELLKPKELKRRLHEDPREKENKVKICRNQMESKFLDLTFHEKPFWRFWRFRVRLRGLH